MTPKETTDTQETATTEPADERFVLDSEEKVNWLLRKLANLEAEKQRVTVQFQTMMAALESDERSLRFRFENDLRAFAALKLTEGGNRKKTVHLLQGSLSFRTMPQAIRVKDLTSAIAFARVTNLPCLETVTEEKFNANIYRQRAQEVLEERGEILPGIEVLPERENFVIKFGKADE
jgi:phage host-nuclease inhibitor protein Gam